ncbi:MAG: hypothetical protein ACREOU_12275 [Candidatus Eiseniibacteriota bacterium]
MGKIRDLASSVGRFAGRLSRRRPDWKETAKGAAAGAAMGASVGKLAGPTGRTAGAATGAIAGAVIAAVRTSAHREAAEAAGQSGIAAGAAGAATATRTPSSAGHGTGYEDAIARRITGLEAEAQSLRDQLEREQTVVGNLTRDNASLRTRIGKLEQQVKRRGWAIILVFAFALAGGTLAAWLLLEALFRAPA